MIVRSCRYCVLFQAQAVAGIYSYGTCTATPGHAGNWLAVPRHLEVMQDNDVHSARPLKILSDHMVWGRGLHDY